MEQNYNYLIGKEIKKFENTEENVIFYTNDEKITICKHEPYCCCGIGEYIDEIIYNGEISGVITNIDVDVNEKEDDYGYNGNVTFYFENKQININMIVSGYDNGYYGVCFTMPVYIEKII